MKIPGTADAVVAASGREVRLTNLDKPFWPADGITKRDLLQYYADVSTWILPHLKGRAMVMKRYPHGAGGRFRHGTKLLRERPEKAPRQCTLDQVQR